MSSLNVNELDFALIKSNLIDYLSGQSEFADYNFEGSGMNILIDLLAYATHYMGVYGNMTFNEMFLQTGLLRASVVSKATELGYFPNQMTSSTATIQVSTPSVIDITVDVGVETVIFKGTNEFGKTFSFVPVSDFTMVSDGVNAIAELPIYEGTFTTDSWTFTAGSTGRYYLENENVDTKHLHVFIRENVSATTFVEWLPAGNVVNVTGEDEVFFLRETIEAKTEVYFGNDVIGKSLLDQNLISVYYIVSQGPEANNINLFSLSAGFNGIALSDFTVTPVTSSREGTGKEEIVTIKNNAPLFYQSQNRANTESDYIALLTSNFQQIQAINVWGGEKNDPPYYGRSMIAIKPTGADYLTDQTKADMLTYLEKVQITGIIPVIVDPLYSYINIKVFAKYNAHLTSETPEDIKQLIIDTVDQHFTDNLYGFDATLKYSALVTEIDDAHKSMFSNYVEMVFRSDVFATSSTSQTYTVKYNNPITPSTVIMEWINAASDSMKVIDDGSGNLIQYKNTVAAMTSVGVVNYLTGELTLPDFNFGISADETIKMLATPATFDIETSLNNILLQGDVDVLVTRVKV